jgi:hypothetical protein
VNDDDRLWLETLAGRRGGGASPTEREATAFRAALRSMPEAEAPAPAAAAREAALIDRAHRAGLFPAGRGVRWLADWRGLALAAAVAGIAVAIGLLDRSPPVDEAVRSAPTGTVVLHAEDPAGYAAEIVDALIAVDVDAVAFERLGGWGVDADLPAPVPAAALDVLARYGIAPPADGVLAIEIDETAP